MSFKIESLSSGCFDFTCLERVPLQLYIFRQEGHDHLYWISCRQRLRLFLSLLSVLGEVFLGLWGAMGMPVIGWILLGYDESVLSLKRVIVAWR